jgi:hypothetical protein
MTTKSAVFVALIICASVTQTASREIPLADIVSTIRQDGLQYIGSGRRFVDEKLIEEDYASAMDPIFAARKGHRTYSSLMLERSVMPLRQRRA